MPLIRFCVAAISRTCGMFRYSLLVCAKQIDPSATIPGINSISLHPLSCIRGIYILSLER